MKSEDNNYNKKTIDEKTRLQKGSRFLFYGAIFVILPGIYAGIRLYQEWKPEYDLTGAVIFLITIFICAFALIYHGFRFRHGVKRKS